MKKILSLICVCFFLLCSCSKTPNITVFSADYPNLHTLNSVPIEELTDEYLEEMSKHQDFKYRYCVALTSAYGDDEPRLCIYNGRSQSWNCAYQGGGGWFTGYSHSDGRAGIIFQSVSTLPSHESNDSVTHVELVLDDRCVAFISPAGENQLYCYAVTGWNGWDQDNVTSIWRLEVPNETNQYTITKEKIVDLPCEGRVSAATSDDTGTIYVLTSGKFFAVSLDGTYTELEYPSITFPIGINSMVHLDRSLYIGTYYGILEYQMDEGVWLWYPINYTA